MVLLRSGLPQLVYHRIQGLYAVDHEQLDWVDEPWEIERMAKRVYAQLGWVGSPRDIERIAKRVRLLCTNVNP